LKKKWKYNETVHQLFIDFKKAYDCIKREHYTISWCSLEFQKKITQLEKINKFKYLRAYVTTKTR